MAPPVEGRSRSTDRPGGKRTPRANASSLQPPHPLLETVAPAPFAAPLLQPPHFVGVVLPQGCGEERGRIGVQLIYYDDKDSRLMYGPKKQVSVGRDKLLVLSPRHEASDERKEVRTLPSPANFNHGQCDDGVGLPVPLSSSSREDHTQRAQLRLVTDEEMD